MNPSAAALAVLIALNPVVTFAAEPGDARPDGFYRIVRGAEESAFPAEPAQIQISEQTIYSQDRGNETFQLGIRVPFDAELSDGTAELALVVGGEVYRPAGRGNAREESTSLSYIFASEEEAALAAALVGAELVLQEHPGHRIRVRFSTPKDEFTTGEEIRATLRITNVGDGPFSFQKGGWNRAPRGRGRYLLHRPPVPVMIALQYR